MPELPEVETVRRTLEVAVGERLICAATVHRRDVIVTRGDPQGGYGRSRAARPDRYPPVRRADLLVGDTVASVVRRGKLMAMIGRSGRSIAFHLGMTGRLLVVDDQDRGGARHRPEHVHASWTFADGACLWFEDPRRFGGIWLVPDAMSLARDHFDRLGPDALSISARQLRAALEGSRRSIKASLLDQRLLAGVGNIYADEALFRAGVDPATAAGACVARAGELAASIRWTLREAVRRGGSTLRDYRDARGRTGEAQRSHRVYGRAGLPCFRCGTVLASRMLAQRTTVWCPECQPNDSG